MVVLWCLLGLGACTIGSGDCVRGCIPYQLRLIPEEAEIHLPYRVIGPCTYQYEPPQTPMRGSIGPQVNGIAYPWWELDEERHILRIPRCPDGGIDGYPGHAVDIVYYIDLDQTARHPDEEESGDRRLERIMSPRKLR